MKIKGSGVLPYTIYKKKLYFLLGQEEYNKGWRDSLKWADFGGKKEDGLTIKQNAIKELVEETNGILGTPVDEYSNKLENSVKIIINGYVCYLVYVKYRDYNKLFKQKKKSRKNLPPEFNEIRNVKWFSDKELLCNISNTKKFRNRLLTIIKRVYL